MQPDDLVVLDGGVAVLVALAMRDVHEEATSERATDVVIVRLVLEGSGDEVAVMEKREWSAKASRSRERKRLTDPSSPWNA